MSDQSVPIWIWVGLYVLMAGAVVVILAVLSVLCGPPVRELRVDDQEKTQRRARRGGA